MKNASPIRVLYFDHTAMLGGGEIALLNLVRQVDRGSVDPVVVLGSEGPLADALRPLAEVHILPLSEEIRHTSKDSLGWRTLLKMRQLIRMSDYVRTLRRFIRQKGIDLIHANSLKADIIGGIAGRLSNTPVIWHVRDRIEDDYLPGPVVRVFRLLSRVLPTFIIANSAATMRTLSLRNEPPGPPQSRAVIHDGTPVSPENDAPVDDGKLEVGLIGRICPWKGQDVFIKAAVMVRDKFPAARFKIVGSALFGEQDYERRIQTLCTQLGLDDVVEFTGFRPDISRVFRDLDVVVHASTIGEPFGQVIIEGMAAGRPVVATRGGGVPEIVAHEETGLLVPMGDDDAMANAICRLLANPAQRLAMGRAGRERVQRHFTLEQTVAAVEAVYSAIAGVRRSRAAHSSPSPVLSWFHTASIRSTHSGGNMNRQNHDLDLSSIVLRRWRECLLWSAPLATLFIAIVLLLPKKYSSEMKILVNNDRQDPIISTDYSPYTPQAREESELQVNSESQLLRSSDVLKDVVLNAGLVNGSSSLPAAEASPAQVDRAIRKLDRDLTVEPVKKSQIINVSYMARTPELANRVLQQLARRYFEVHVQVHNTNGTYQLFDQQATRYADDLGQSEASLVAFRTNYSMLVMPEEQELLAQRATEARAAFEDADAQVAQLEQRLKEASHAIAGMDGRIITQTRVMPNSDLVQRLASMLADLNNRRTEMAAKFRSDDRLVVQLDHEIAGTQAMLDRANAQTHTEQTTDINLIRQTSEKDIVADKVALAGAKARRDKLKTDLGQYREEMHDLAGATVKHDALVRRVKESQDNYLLYSKKREQARIESVLDQGRVANVAIAQQPTLTVEPAFPNLFLAIPLALALALCGGGGLVCGNEYLEGKKMAEGDPFLGRRVAVAS